MKLTLLAPAGGITRLACSEDVTLLDFQAKMDALTALLGSECYTRQVLLNLEKVSYMDSAGFGWLMMAHKHFKDGGGRLVIHSIAPMVHHALRVLGLYAVLHLADNETDALKLLQPERP